MSSCFLVTTVQNFWMNYSFTMEEKKPKIFCWITILKKSTFFALVPVLWGSTSEVFFFRQAIAILLLLWSFKSLSVVGSMLSQTSSFIKLTFTSQWHYYFHCEHTYVQSFVEIPSRNKWVQLMSPCLIDNLTLTFYWLWLNGLN